MINFFKKCFNLVMNFFVYYRYGGVSYAKRIGVTVGEHCRIFTKNFGSEPFLVSIGNNVTVTPGVHFVTHDGSGSLFIDNNGRKYFYAPISIGNNVFIGINAIILPGVKIEDNVIVAAGSVITKSVPVNSIVGGTPAKIIGNFDDFKFKVNNNWISDREMDYSLSYIERIKKITDQNFKPFMK